jgi:hypothetical protein
VNFTNATVDNAPVGNANVSALTMVSSGGVTEATPSALTGGNSFSQPRAMAAHADHDRHPSQPG